MVLTTTKTPRKRVVKNSLRRRASSSLTPLDISLALPFHIGEQSCNFPIAILQDADNITAINILQTCKPIVRRVLRFCISGPVIIPPRALDSRRSLMNACKFWREIILSSPEYWTSIVFLPGPFRSITELHLLTRQALQRSSGRPLDLDFVGDIQELLANTTAPRRAEDLIFGRGKFSLMWTIVQPNRGRIRSLRLMVCTKEDSLALYKIKGCHYPRLEALDIAIPSSFFPEFSASFGFNRRLDKGLDTFPHMSRISLHLLGNTAFDPLSMSRLPWSQITNLNFATIYIRPNIFTDILRRSSPSLTRAIFSLKFTRAPHRLILPNLGLVHMPALLELHLTLHNFSEDTRLFNAIRLPVLKCLHIQVIDEYVKTCDMTAFAGMLGTIQALEQLQITHTSPRLKYPPYSPPTTRIPMAPDFVEGLFQGLKHIKILCLPRGMVLPLSVIDKLARGGLLPFLTQLVLTVTESNWEQVLAMVQSRNEMAMKHQLEPKEFRLHFPPRRLRPCKLQCVRVYVPRLVYGPKQNEFIGIAESLRRSVRLDIISDDFPTYFV